MHCFDDPAAHFHALGMRGQGIGIGHLDSSRGVDQHGQSYSMRDPMAAQLQALALAHADDVTAAVQALGTLRGIWGLRLAQDRHWLSLCAHWLDRITRFGVLGAMQQLENPA